jgi:hypothetical protein
LARASAMSAPTGCPPATGDSRERG